MVIYISLLFICLPLINNGQSLAKGELLIAGVNQLNRGNICSTDNSLTHYDNIIFLTLKDIENGEIITLTDNRYLGNQQFTTTEGFYQLERVGGKIEKGNFFRIDLPFGSITNNPIFNGWKLIDSYYRISLSSNGDQLFILNNGSWNNQGVYSGKILYGYNSFNAWTTIADPSNSILPESNQDEFDITSFHFTPNESTSSLYRIYNGPLNHSSKNEWLIRLLNPNNWISYNSNVNINDCILFEQKANLLLNTLITIEDFEEIESCINLPIQLEINEESNILSYQWIKSNTSDFSNYTIIGNTSVLNYSNQETSDYYVTCLITYQLKWYEDNSVLRTSSNTVVSKIYHVKNLSQPIISPIYIN